MDRDKILELAREAELVRQLALEVPFVVDRLERFAALIAAETLKPPKTSVVRAWEDESGRLKVLLSNGELLNGTDSTSWSMISGQE